MNIHIYDFETEQLKAALRSGWDQWRETAGYAVGAERVPSRLIRIYAAILQAHRSALRLNNDHGLADSIFKLLHQWSNYIDGDLLAIVNTRINEEANAPIANNEHLALFYIKTRDMLREEGYAI